MVLQRCLQLVVTGEIPDVRTVPVTQDVVHPTVVQLPIAIAFARIRRNINENMEKIQNLKEQFKPHKHAPSSCRNPRSKGNPMKSAKTHSLTGHVYEV